MRRLIDAFSQAVVGIFRNGVHSFVTVFVLTSCLLFIGSFGLISMNIDYNLEDVTDLNEIEVFLDYDADMIRVAEIEKKIKSLDNVEKVEYISKNAGLSSMQEQYSDYAYLLADIPDDENPLSDSFKIIYSDNDRVTTLDYELKQIEGVRKVNSRLDIAATINSLRNGISFVFVWFTALCGVVCMFVIINTIKLSVYSRREEIAIMRYIGAGRAYIAVPFMIEGCLIGIAGAAIAFFLEKLIYSSLGKFIAENMGIVKLYEYSELAGPILILFFGVSVACGVIGSIISIGRYTEK